MSPAGLPKDVHKQLLIGGRPKGSLPYPNGTRVKFHFKSLLTSSQEDEVVDDTRTMTKPMELIIGKKFKMEVWEEMIQTMMPGEQAKFTVPESWVVCYPMVSKAVRDSERPHVERSHHCCGMMQQGIGYPDLDKLMEKPQPMTFIFDLIDVERPGEYETESWQLTEQEKLDSVPLLQSQGNQKFTEGDVDGAIKKYFEAIARLEQLTLRERPGSEEVMALEDQKVPLLLNYSFCLMKQGEFYEAIQHLNTALTTQPNSVKGIFRRAKCHRSVGNFEDAREDYKQALQLDPSLRSVVLKELEGLAFEEKETVTKDKARFQKIFSDISNK